MPKTIAQPILSLKDVIGGLARGMDGDDTRTQPSEESVVEQCQAQAAGSVPTWLRCLLKHVHLDDANSDSTILTEKNGGVGAGGYVRDEDGRFQIF